MSTRYTLTTEGLIITYTLPAPASENRQINDQPPFYSNSPNPSLILSEPRSYSPTLESLPSYCTDTVRYDLTPILARCNIHIENGAHELMLPNAGGYDCLIL